MEKRVTLSETTCATLHISELDPLATKADISSTFQNYLSCIESVIIRRKPDGTNSANVHFLNSEAAEFARRELTWGVIRGRRFVIDELNPAFNVFIKNFHGDATDQDLEQEFSACGRIISTKIARDEAGRSRGYGFIQFDSAEATSNALGRNGHEWRGGQLIVERFRSREQREYAQWNGNLLVFGFHTNTTKPELDTLFSRFGEILSSHIQQKKVDRKMKSLGFIHFREISSSEAAVKALNGRKALGGTLTVQIPTNHTAAADFFKTKWEKKQDQWKHTNLMFTRLPPTYKEEHLIQLCQPYGPIESIKMPLKEIEESKKGKIVRKMVSTGAAFVNFKDAKSAERAQAGLDGKVIQQLGITVRFWRPREE
jgi:polyadenylate-binding protein